MLRILINDKSEKVLPLLDGYISHPSDYLSLIYEDAWFEDDFVKKLLKEENEIEVCSHCGCLKHSTWGSINVGQISSGIAGIILLYKTDCKINGDRLGDNCWKYVMEIAKNKDINVVLRHIPKFPSDFKGYLINEERVVDFGGYLHAFINLAE